MNVARAAAGLLFFAAGILQMKAAADRVNLVLPTANTALLRGDGAAFYQVVQRNINGVVSYPWEGGKYGFVRDPRELAGQIVFTRFHEGMDIRPLQRDARGEPLDDVRSIADAPGLPITGGMSSLNIVGMVARTTASTRISTPSRSTQVNRSSKATSSA